MEKCRQGKGTTLGMLWWLLEPSIPKSGRRARKDLSHIPRKGCIGWAKHIFPGFFSHLSCLSLGAHPAVLCVHNHFSPLFPPFLPTAGIPGWGIPQLCMPALFSEGLLQWVSHSSLSSPLPRIQENPSRAFQGEQDCRNPIPTKFLRLHPKDWLESPVPHGCC